jgi:hypothetical protein
MMKLKGWTLNPEDEEEARKAREEDYSTDYPSGYGFAVGVLLFIGVVCLVAGGLYLTRVTAGVGGIAAACFFGIVARIVQAGRHHKEQMGREQ